MAVYRGRYKISIALNMGTLSGLAIALETLSHSLSTRLIPP